MGKQTKKSSSKFGGAWTKQKLLIIEEYLKSYAMVLKNFKVKKIYIDAFAGSGITDLSQEFENDNTYSFFDMYENLQCCQMGNEKTIIEGSALLSLKYDFDEYYFLELDKKRISELENNIKEKFPSKITKVHFINGDSNEELKIILNSITVYDRCLMFLDPYSLEANWDTLKAIANGSGNDVWYLFPLNALTRILPKDRSKLNVNELLVSKILGTNEWENTLYEESEQGNMFGDVKKNRVSFNKLIPFVISRFKTIFTFVSDDVIILKNNKSSSLFLLCFMMTNKSPKAQDLANKLVKGIKLKLEKKYGKN